MLIVDKDKQEAIKITDYEIKVISGKKKIKKEIKKHRKTCKLRRNMETLEDIKTDVCDMLVYCDVISSKDSSAQSKIGFARLMGKVAKRMADKCDKLEKELESVNAKQDKKDKRG